MHYCGLGHHGQHGTADGWHLWIEGRYLPLNSDFESEQVIRQALGFAKGSEPVIVDVNIDYSKKTMLTKGVVKTNLSRFPLSEKLRFLSRAVKRHTIG